jgi:aspartate carbamoyltransferase catalytic subunit
LYHYDAVKMGDDIKAELDAKGVKWEESSDLISVASEVDVLYQTRIQKARGGTLYNRPQNGLHPERFTRRTVDTQNGLHTERFTHRTVYT